MQGLVLLDVSQHFAAIHFREIQVQQDQIGTRRLGLRSLASQEGHGLYPVGSHVQLDQWIDLVKGFLRQPQVSRTVLDQKNLERHRLSLRWASRFPLDSPGLPGTHSLPHSRQVCCVGNLTVASQKSLILLTSFSNASNCTGLLR